MDIKRAKPHITQIRLATAFLILAQFLMIKPPIYIPIARGWAIAIFIILKLIFWM